MAATTAAVEDVKLKMHKNFETLLTNVEKADSIYDKTEVLQQKAKMFEKNAKTLKQRELCKNYKMMAIIALVVIVVLLIIILPIALQKSES